MINIHEPRLTFKDFISLMRVFFTKWIGRTQYSFDVENKFAKFLNLPEDHVLGVTNCTEAIHQVLEYVFEKKGKGEIITQSMGYLGVSHAIVSSGFKVKYCDVENFDTMNPSWKDIEKRITSKTKAVLLNYYGGRPIKDIEKISSELKRRGIYLIEDCATSIKSSVDNQYCGSFGDFSVFSFDVFKVITCGDGGMVYCKSKKDYDELRMKTYLGMKEMFGTYGKSKNNDEWWVLNPLRTGRRTVLNNLSSSILSSQINQYDKFVERQNNISKWYREYLSDIENINVPEKLEDNLYETNYIFWIQAERRNELANYLKDNGIFTTFRYYPNHLTELYKTKYKLPVTEDLVQNVLCLPCHKNLSKNQVKYVCNKIRSFYEL